MLRTKVIVKEAFTCNRFLHVIRKEKECFDDLYLSKVSAMAAFMYRNISCGHINKQKIYVPYSN